METATYQKMLEVVEEIERGKRRRVLAIIGAVMILLAVAVIGTATFVNYRSDAATRKAIEQSRTQMEELCSSGAIDCRGSSGLPGPRGGTGTGIASVTCEGGRFVFTTTAGDKTRIGDCIAEAGPRGRAGRDGQDGARGPRGVTGATGRDGQDGARGPRGPRGPRGERGAIGPEGPVQRITCGLLRSILLVVECR